MPEPGHPEASLLPALMALVFGLRERGMALMPIDVHATARLISAREHWDLDELRTTLAAIFVKKPRDKEAFDALFSEHFRIPAPEPAHSGTPRPEHPTYFQQHQIDKPDYWLRRYIRSLGTALSAAAGSVLRHLVALRSTPAFTGTVAAVAIALLIWLSYPPGPQGPTPGGTIPLTLASMVKASIVVTVLLLMALALWRAGVLRRPARDDTTGASKAPVPLQTSPGDETLFRLGTLGGAPPDFLRRAVASEIVDLFGYRWGDYEPASLDVDGTIEAQIRESDPCEIIPDRRRELPLVLIVMDIGATAHHWHTLATEFAKALEARGVPHETIEFRGSFFDRRDGRSVLGAAGLALDAAVAAPGWTVTSIFAEAQRLSPTDSRLLQRIAENGPVLFLERRHPRLWDDRQRRLERSGITVVPATEHHLRDGLARVFAPDKVGAAAAPTVVTRVETRRVSVEAIVAEILGGDALVWAAECALVQPVSYALAERLRAAHPALCGPLGQLEFSRLTALPGSWLGAEGLRFDPEVRVMLKQHFSDQQRDEKPSQALSIINAAFATEPTGETASAIWRYARAQAQVYGRGADDAFADIEAVMEQGIIDPQQVSAFLDGLVLPAQPLGRREVSVPEQPSFAWIRQRLGDRGAAATGGPRPASVAEWTVGLPECRLNFGGTPSDQASSGAPSGAAFLSNGRHLLVDGQVDNTGRRNLFVIDGMLGTRTELDLDWSSRSIGGIWTARDADVAVVATDDSRLSILRSPAAGGDADTRFRFAMTGLTGTEDMLDQRASVVGISPNGDWVAFRDKDMQLVVVNTQSIGSPSVRVKGVRALTFPSNDRLLVGLDYGEVVQISLGGEGDDDQRPRYRLDMAPSALALVTPQDLESRLVAGLDDGRIVIVDPGTSPPGASAGIMLSWRARRVVPLANRTVERQGSTGTGISVAVLGEHGECDIVGLPLPSQGTASLPFDPFKLLRSDLRRARDGRQVLGISARSRRIALVRGGALEVRPLLYHASATSEQHRVPEKAPI